MNLFVSSCLLVNLISVGYLSLPWAFAQAGLLLSTIGFGLVLLQTFITVTYVLEACARAEALRFLQLANGGDELGTSSERFLQPCNSEDDEVSACKSLIRMEQQKQEQQEYSSEWLHEISGKVKFELTDLCQMFLGERFRNMLFASISFELYAINWTRAAIFARGMSATLSLTTDANLDYLLFLAAFAAIVIPASCMKLQSQLILQIGFLVARHVMVGLMMVTVFFAQQSEIPHFDDAPDGAASADVVTHSSVPFFNFPMMYIMLQISLFSTCHQVVVPGLAHEADDKSSLKRLFGFGVLFVFCVTTLLSLMLSSFFGPDRMQDSSNLNWAAYHGGTGTLDADGQRIDVSLWARSISWYITSFPALDSIACFPLSSSFFGEMIRHAWYGEKVHMMDHSTKQRIFFSLIASVPELIGACFVQDISVIANYAGLFTIASFTICPSLLAIYSRKAMVENHLTPETVYKTFFSKDAWAWTLSVLAMTLIIYVIVCTALNNNNHNSHSGSDITSVGGQW